MRNFQKEFIENISECLRLAGGIDFEDSWNENASFKKYSPRKLVDNSVNLVKFVNNMVKLQKKRNKKK